MGTPAVANKKRLVWMLGIVGLLFVLLLGRLFYLQILQGDELSQMAASQQTRDTSLSAARGSILDAGGVVLAQSGTAYKVLVWPAEVDASDATRVATELASLLSLEYDSVLAKVTDETKSEIVLKRAVDRELIDELSARKLGSGVGYALDTKRYYPLGSLFSQLLGFTTVDGVGQSGLEQKYDKYLAGEDGREIVETDRKQRALPYGLQEIIEPTDGCTVVLTTNSVIQSVLEKSLDEAVKVNNAKNAQGIIINCKTGAIEAIATSPGYDPNSPPRSDVELLNQLSRNRVVTDAYEPGSTFKVITLSAAIDSAAASESSSYECPGFHYVNGERIRCWRSKGHGTQNLREATQNSCNCAFITMALEIGREKLYDYIYAFGFGSATGSGISGESGGIVTHEKYVNENTLARIGFGQSIAVTPMQLITAVGAAVNGGKLMQPYIVERIISHNGETVLENGPTVVRQVISPDTSAKVRDILESVVTDGSGKNGGVAGYRVGGKTGTAQKYEDGAIADGKLIASFIGFAPADDPEYVCLILVDEPQVGVVFGSTVAAPFVSAALEETLRYYGYLPEAEVKTTAVPDVTGLTVAEAVAKLEEIGLEGVHQAEDDVVAQVPAAGSTVQTGTEVLLYTAATSVETQTDMEEDTMTTVPDVNGLTRIKAYDTLKEAGLTLLIEPPDQTGKAVYQSPAAGEKVEKGTEVLVDFSDVDIGN